MSPPNLISNSIRALSNHVIYVFYLFPNKTKNFLRTRTMPAHLPTSSSSPKWSSVQFSSLSHVRLFMTPWTVAHQASQSITNSQSLLTLMSIELVMPSNHLILCCPLLLPPPIFPSIRVFSNKSVLCFKWPILEFQLQHQSFQLIFRMDSL